MAVLRVQTAILHLGVFDVSLRDSLSRRSSSTRRLIAAKGLGVNSLQSYNHGETIYFVIQPINLAVLSRSAINGLVTALLNLIKGAPALEMVCLNSRENFENNRIFLMERLVAEDNPAIRSLLEKDRLFFDQIRIQTASAREFLMALRVQKAEELPAAVSRMGRLLRECGFRARAAERDDLMRIVSVYFTQNMTQTVYEDLDGERRE